MKFMCDIYITEVWYSTCVSRILSIVFGLILMPSDIVYNAVYARIFGDKPPMYSVTELLLMPEIARAVTVMLLARVETRHARLNDIATERVVQSNCVRATIKTKNGDRGRSC